MRRIAGIAAVAALALSACSGAGTVAPAPGDNPSPESGFHGVPQARVLTVPDARKPTKTTFTIRVPLKKHRNGRAPHFISPSTKSVVISVDNVAQPPANLTPSSRNCTVSSPIAYLTCTLTVTVSLGAHTFSVVTYDKTGGTGNRLGAAMRVPFDVEKSGVGPAITLGGLATRVAILPSNVPQITGSQSSGFAIFGSNRVTFSILPVDADGNYIVGPGSPAISVPLPSGALAVGTPPPSSPNTWSFTSSFAATNPTVSLLYRLPVLAIPVPGSDGQTIRTTMKVALFQPWLYVANNQQTMGPSYAWKMGVTDEYGGTVSIPGSAFSNLPEPTGIAYDPHVFWPYVPSIDENAVCVYDVLGDLIHGNEYWDGLENPTDIVYAKTVYGDRLYVANSGWTPSFVHAKHALPIPRHHKRGSLKRPHWIAADPVEAFDEYGNRIATSGMFQGLNAPMGLAWDPHNSTFYVTDNSEDTVYQYDADGNKLNQFAGLPDTGYGGIAFDSHNNQLYAVMTDAYDGQSILVIDESGHQRVLQPGAFSGLTQPSGITYDPYNGFLYVSDYATATVHVYDENGVTQSPVGGIPSGGLGPWGVAVIP